MKSAAEEYILRLNEKVKASNWDDLPYEEHDRCPRCQDLALRRARYQRQRKRKKELELEEKPGLDKKDTDEQAEE